MVKYTDTTNIYSSSSKTKAQDCVCNGLGYCSMFNYLWLNLNKVKFQWDKFVLSLVLRIGPKSFVYPKWFNLPSVKRHNYIKSINIDTKIEMIFGGYDIFMTHI